MSFSMQIETQWMRRTKLSPILMKQLDLELPAHSAVLQRFGRYPHRNKLKGRATTTYPALQVLVDVPNEIAWNILSFWNVAVPWD